MKTFAADSRLYGVKRCKEFRPFRKYILSPEWCSSVMTICKTKNLEVTALTLNKMKDGMDEGRISYVTFPHKDIATYPFIAGENKPFVPVFSGGDYDDVCSLVEGFAVAVKLNGTGYNAFVGQHRVGKQTLFTNPLEDVD